MKVCILVSIFILAVVSIPWFTAYNITYVTKETLTQTVSPTGLHDDILINKALQELSEGKGIYEYSCQWERDKYFRWPWQPQFTFSSRVDTLEGGRLYLPEDYTIQDTIRVGE